MSGSHSLQAVVFLSVLLSGVLVAAPSSADAQVRRALPGSRYESPFGPTITPNLNFFRDDVGVLDVYNTIVRPDRLLRREQKQQTTSIGINRTGLGQVQGQVQGLQKVIVAPTGIGSRFMDLGHYYSFSGAGTR